MWEMYNIVYVLLLCGICIISYVSYYYVRDVYYRIFLIIMWEMYNIVYSLFLMWEMYNIVYSLFYVGDV